MAIDTITPRTRRAMLAATAGGVLALVAEALGRPLTGRAADGDVVHVGDDLTATRTTTITSEGDGFVGVTTDSRGSGSAGVRGHADMNSRGAFGVDGTNSSPDGIGVRGWVIGYTGRNRGVYGNSDSDEGVGVYGDAGASNGRTFGVAGTSGSSEGAGVYGRSIGATGVVGVSGGDPGPYSLPATAMAGVYGLAQQDDGRGGVFSGKAAQLRLLPASTDHPVSGELGDLFLDKAGTLWLCKGDTDWKQIV